MYKVLLTILLQIFSTLVISGEDASENALIATPSQKKVAYDPQLLSQKKKKKWQFVA